nr:hypothetical protein [Tanacetum cinerariifolium]
KWIYFRSSGLSILQRLGLVRGNVMRVSQAVGDYRRACCSAPTVDVSAKTVAEDVAPAELQRRKKRKTKVVDAGEPLHPAKKLRGDYGALGVPAIGGKSQSAVQHLLTEAVQHAEVRGGAMLTLPFASSSVSTTPEREGGDYTELLAGANLRTLEAPQRLVISSDSSDPSGVNIIEAEVDYVVRTSGQQRYKCHQQGSRHQYDQKNHQR